MKVISVLAIASISGVMGVSTVSANALAWEPKGVITKSVMNQTAGSALSDANDIATAISAKPGDVLKYVIEIRNDGVAGENNQMHSSKLSDALPAGVELVSDASKRIINEDLGVIKPGEKITKEYLVKVTSTKNDEAIENKACFSGDSEAKDNPQKGCDVAVVKISVPKVETPVPAPKPTPSPTPVPAPTTPTAPTAPEESLPKTGPSEFMAPVAALTSGALAYAGRLIAIKRRQQ